jgi:hypothetical protein
VGEGVVGNATLASGSVPLSAVAPLSVGELRVPAALASLDGFGSARANTSIRRVLRQFAVGDRSLAQWVYLTYAAPLSWW